MQPKGKTTSQPRLLKCLPPPPQPLAPNAIQGESTGLFLQPCPHLPQSQMLRLIRMENFNCLENEGAENRTASTGVLVPNDCLGAKKNQVLKAYHQWAAAFQSSSKALGLRWVLPPPSQGGQCEWRKAHYSQMSSCGKILCP